jgi:hypothetical protein
MNRKIINEIGENLNEISKGTFTVNLLHKGDLSSILVRTIKEHSLGKEYTLLETTNEPYSKFNIYQHEELKSTIYNILPPMMHGMIIGTYARNNMKIPDVEIKKGE